VVEAVCVDPARVDEFWPYVAGLLWRATERCGDWTLTDLRAALSTGALLWIAWDGAEMLAVVVTQLLPLPRGKVCNVVAGAGTQMDRWCALMSDIEKYARSEGCVSVRVDGRPGWARALAGFRIERVVLEKRV
jgi:hypothetical protein